MSAIARASGRSRCPADRVGRISIFGTCIGLLSFCSVILGTATFAAPVPTFTDPVSTSKAGVWPPVAVTPLRATEIWGAWAPRIWLISSKPVITPAMIARTRMIRMNSTARIGISNCLSAGLQEH